MLDLAAFCVDHALKHERTIRASLKCSARLVLAAT
jgi:hypothetical protein